MTTVDKNISAANILQKHRPVKGVTGKELPAKIPSSIRNEDHQRKHK